MWESAVEPERPAGDDNVTRRMRIACWIPKATDAHWQYVILITFPLQEWFHERASMLRYTYSTLQPVLFYYEVLYMFHVTCLLYSPRFFTGINYIIVEG